MVPLDVPEFDRWRAAAERAAGAATAQGAAGFFEWACFLHEQSAQLAVKAILHGVGAGRWGHDLTALEAAAADAVGPAWPTDLAAPAERLARFYLPTRYPDAVPGGVPGDRFSAEDEQSAARDRGAITAGVDCAWNALVAEANGGSER